jgi:hypothetical protein
LTRRLIDIIIPKINNPLDKSRRSKMKKPTTLETLVTPVRISWHGVLSLALGAGCVVLASEAKKHGMPLVGEILFPVLGGGAFGAGFSFYKDGLTSYYKIRESVARCGELKEGYLEKHLKWYCNRQGAKAAAVSLGLEDEYNKIVENYDGLMYDTSIPNW